MAFADWWEYSLWGAKRNGRTDGGGNIPTKSQAEHAAYERQLAMRASKEVRGVASEWEEADRTLKGQYVAALREFIDARNRAKKEGAEAEEVLAKHRLNTDKLNGSSDNPLLNRTAYWAIILLIAVGEIPLTAKAFALMGENNMMTYVFALVLCVSVPAAAHFAGVILREKFNWKNLIILLLDIGALVAVLGSVAWVREKYFEADALQALDGVKLDTHTVSLVFFAIQLFIFLVAATASYFAHDSHPDRLRCIRESKTTSHDLIKETGEAKDAEKHLDAAARLLAEREAHREKAFAAFSAKAEEVFEQCKMMIETYRCANIRARGDREIVSFCTYPELTIPVCLRELDKECGFAVPEASPLLCPLCGETNHFSAIRCKKCGNDIH